MTVYEARLSDGTVLPAYEGSYVLAPTRFDVVQRARLAMLDPEGANSVHVPIGTPVDFYRDGVLDYRGLVETRLRRRNGGGEDTEVRLVAKWPQGLRRRILSEDSNYLPSQAVNRRKRVRFNPWRWYIYRHPDGTLGGDGLPMALDGVTISEAMQAVVGGALILQHTFLDDRLTASRDAVDQIGCYADSQSGDKRPALQLWRRSATAFASGIQTFNCDLPPGMGLAEVNTASNAYSYTGGTVLLIGKDNGVDPVFTVVAGFTTVAPVPVKTPNYLGSGLTAWLYTFTQADLAALTALQSRNAPFTISLNGGTNPAATSKVHYMRLHFNRALGYRYDTGHSGIPYSITPYYDPETGATTGASVWVEDDLAWLDAATAVERLRRSARADTTENPSGLWDAWMDVADGTFHFEPRRGEDTGRTFSLGDGVLDGLRYEENGERLAFMVLALGSGRGSSQVFAPTDDPFINGVGWFDPDVQPGGPTGIPGGGTYGDLPITALHRDKGTHGVAQVKRDSEAFFDERRAPMVRFEPTFIPFRFPDLEVGDTCTFTDEAWGLEERARLVALEHAWSAAGESRTPTFQTHFEDTEAQMRAFATDNDRATSNALPLLDSLPASGNQFFFDTATQAVFVINVPEQGDVERVLVAIQAVPYTITASGGVTTFKGDAPGATPVYGQGIKLGIDPANPHAFADPAEEHGLRFGEAATPRSILFDVTRYLTLGPDGAIARGAHRLCLLGVTATNNAGGKAGVQVTPYFIRNEVKG